MVEKLLHHVSRFLHIAEDVVGKRNQSGLLLTKPETNVFDRMV